MAGYKERVKQDLDRWIAAGLVPVDRRDAILATIPDARRLDAATALAWVGGLLLGIAVIAFVAANWEITPKLVRFAILLAAFLGFASLAAWAVQRGRPVLSNIALMIAALVFAASIGLTGQIFDIVGDPRSAAYGAGVAGLALALAGRSTGAATVGLVFIAIGDLIDRRWFESGAPDAPWMLVAAPLGAFLALRWGSSPLAHVSALAIIYCFGWFAGRTEADAGVFLFLAIALGAIAAGALLHIEPARVRRRILRLVRRWRVVVLRDCGLPALVRRRRQSDGEHRASHRVAGGLRRPARARAF